MPASIVVKAAGITDAQRQAYLERTERKDLVTDAQIDEEIICDAMEDTAKRTGLLQSIAGKKQRNRKLWQTNSAKSPRNSSTQAVKKSSATIAKLTTSNLPTGALWTT